VRSRGTAWRGAQGECYFEIIFSKMSPLVSDCIGLIILADSMQCHTMKRNVRGPRERSIRAQAAPGVIHRVRHVRSLRLVMGIPTILGLIRPTNAGV
jgi:hypothetical protein